MKTFCIALLLTVASVAGADEKVLVSDPPIKITGEYVTNAMWATSEKLPWTVMSTKSSNPKWFYISYAGGDTAVPKKVLLTIDDEELVTGLGLNGQALVYAKNVVIKQLPAVGKITGQWATFPVEAIGKIPLRWTLDTRVATSALLAKLDEPRDFLVSFDQVVTSGCSEPKMMLIVDGLQFDLKPGDASRKRYEFRPGSTVMANGKLVEVSVATDCVDMIFAGNMQLLMK